MKFIENNGSNLVCEFTEEELITLKNVLCEVCWGASAIEEFEFQTLIGQDREYTGNLCKEIRQLMDDLNIVE